MHILYDQHVHFPIVLAEIGVKDLDMVIVIRVEICSDKMLCLPRGYTKHLSGDECFNCRMPELVVHILVAKEKIHCFVVADLHCRATQMLLSDPPTVARVSNRLFPKVQSGQAIRSLCKEPKILGLEKRMDSSVVFSSDRSRLLYCVLQQRFGFMDCLASEIVFKNRLVPVREDVPRRRILRIT